MLRVESAQLGSDDGEQKLSRTDTESKEGADEGSWQRAAMAKAIR
jgi:hypothetical protein